jgi:hypothetical protein
MIMSKACGAWRAENAYKILVVRPQWKRPLGGPRHRWKIFHEY